MTHFLSFFLIFLVALLFSAAFKRLHFPWVIALIVGGVVIGPFGLELLEVDQTIGFFGEVGLIFLMFMAGLEVKLSSLKRKKKEIASFSALNSLVPFAVAVILGLAFDYHPYALIMLGIVFMSSSVAVAIPSLKRSGLLKTDFGKVIISSITLEDLASLLVLSVFLQIVDPILPLPLPLFYLLLFIFIVVVKWLIPRARWALLPSEVKESDLFEKEFRFVFVALLGMVVFFEFIGLHAIIAGFLAGLLLSDSIESKELREKISVISYGVFIPVFFVVVGMEMDIGAFLEATELLFFTVAIVISSMAAKFMSGYWGGKVNGFNKVQSQFAGIATIPQLSTGLAAAFVGFEVGILERDLLTAIIVLSVFTTLCGPLLINYFLRNKSLMEDDDRYAE